MSYFMKNYEQSRMKHTFQNCCSRFKFKDLIALVLQKFIAIKKISVNDEQYSI